MMVKTILVAGATGFVGSHVVHALHKAGYQVIILKRSSSRTERLNDIISDLISYDTDTTSLANLFTKHQVDVVINFATEYGRGNTTPLSQLCNTNIIFPLQLIEAAKTNHVPYYWNIDSYWNTDSSPADSISFYAYTKKVIKEILQFGFTSNIQVFNLKFFHPFGPQDDAKKFLPMVLDTLRYNAPLDMTVGTQQLDCIYIKEVTSIFTFLLKHITEFKAPFEHFDIGTGQVTPLRTVVESMKKFIGSTSELHYGAIPLRKNEIMFAQADIQRLLATGYKFNYTLESGLQDWLNS